MRSLDQRRAAAAYRAAGAVSAEAAELARALPTLLQTNGLLATWAHYLAKKEPHYRDLLAHIVGHLRSRPELRVPPTEDVHQVLQTWLGTEGREESGLQGPELRALTGEALAFAVWLKRAAEARGAETESTGGPR